MSSSQQLRNMVRTACRQAMHHLLPSLCDQDPMDEIAMGGKLSVAYDKMSRLGVIEQIRATNDRIMREHFEKSCGMTSSSSSSSWGRSISSLMSTAFIVILLASIFSIDSSNIRSMFCP